MAIDVNNIFGLKAVPGATQAELTARTSNVVGQWHASRKPWVHIMSLAANCASNGASQFGVGFGPGGGAGYTSGFERPQPVVESVDVKKQGELGTTRRVTIKLKAFTDDQLNTIARCYFIPGMSVRIQYGWNMDAQGAKAPNPFTSVKTDPEAIALIQSNQSKYSSYDGLQGIVTTYNVSLDDNVWNITLEVTGAGTSMGSAKMSNSQNGCICEVKPEPKPDGTQDEEPIKIKLSDIKALLIDIIDDISNKNNIKYGGKSKQIYKYKYEGYDRDEYGREDTGGAWYTFGLTDGIGTQEATYISLGALQRIISCASQAQRNGEPDLFEVNSDGVLIAKPSTILCADPRIAYIPGGQLSLDGSGAASAIGTDGIILDNILVNAIHCLKVLLQEEKGDDNLQKYLEIILKDINYHCGSPWEFDFISTSEAEPRLTKEKAPTRITIVDTKKSKTPSNAYTLKANSKNSCVRSVKMDMKLTDAMKMQALYSGNTAVAPPTNSDPCNGRFTAFTKISGTNLAKPPATAPSKPSCGGGSTKCNDANKEPNFADKFDKLKKGVTDDTVSAVRGELVSQMGKDKEAICKGSLIPIEFSVVVDGIGGFSFGQSISCDRFPGEFAKYFSYQVTSVEHSITNDDWTTSINTVGRLL